MADPISEQPDGLIPTAPTLLLEQARNGRRLALSRLMSMVERGGPHARELGALAFAAGAPTTHSVGITGAPGSGKSSITSEVIAVARLRDQRIAVLAVDPSSPFTGGAILGDRIRMGAHSSDDGVYIRSMASRGHLGGLSLAAPLGVRVLAAAGWPWVLIETVGVGQVEVEIAGTADTTVVVVNPGWGDAVQANKAGLMEIADIFVINKSDRPGTHQTRMDILQMLGLSELSGLSGPGSWEPPIIETVGTTGQGADELWDAIGTHRDHLVSSGELAVRRSARAENELAEVLRQMLAARITDLEATPSDRDIKAKLEAGQLDPYGAAALLIDKAFGGDSLA